MDPLHITEFASPRYFDKLKSLNEAPENTSGARISPGAPATTTTDHPPTHTTTFTIPIGNPRPQTGRRRRSDDTVRSGDKKKRSLGHDPASQRSQRRPSFALSIATFRAKVAISQPKSSQAYVEHDEFSFEGPDPELLSLGDLFFALPSELQLQVITPLPIPTILNLRLTSRSFHSMISLNESTITRYHLANSVPHYALGLYPVPNPAEINLHFLCSIWHRLHVASKLSKVIAEHTTREIFLRNTDAKYSEFQPQHTRMRRRLMPLIFTMFHFFERYRELHARHLVTNGVPLRLQPFTLNPIERQIMDMYDDQTLIQVHQVFPLILSSYSRRLRPPSYAGRLERSIKGYLKDKPADEVYSTILTVGGLRQAERFWQTKGYNARRAAVDAWYTFIIQGPTEAPGKSKLSKITTFGRKKTAVAAVEAATAEGAAGHDVVSCDEWFCVKPSCAQVWKQRYRNGLVFNTSMSAGPPMSPLPRDQLRLLLLDQQPLTSIWLPTAEALVLDRNIVESSQKIKRNTQVLLELIREDGTTIEDDWAPGISQARETDYQHFLGVDGAGVQDL
ncbi:MAG: hypothetical protein M1818_005436 [Claussenomyces sp. TS43310]|nr:MAG: hypothetical protein M1818_005436 [Claussenomyces sp. TS43310]